MRAGPPTRVSCSPRSHPSPARLGDIEDQGLACIGHHMRAGDHEVIRGRAVVLDGDTFELAGEHVRLIGINASEANRMCWLDGLNRLCRQMATAVMFTRVSQVRSR